MLRIGDQVKVRDPEVQFEGIPLKDVPGEITDVNAWDDNILFVVFDKTWNNNGHTEDIASWFGPDELREI